MQWWKLRHLAWLKSTERLRQLQVDQLRRVYQLERLGFGPVRIGREQALLAEISAYIEHRREQDRLARSPEYNRESVDRWARPGNTGGWDV